MAGVVQNPCAPFVLLGLLLAGFAWLAGPAARAQSFEGGDLGVDRSTPIEITADAFEVRPNDNLGIFEGAVRVAQGRITILCDRVEVHYLSSGDDAQPDGISRLDALGNVRIRSPQEQATGTWARYDVAGQEVRLGGGIMLSRGDTVLEGEELSIDLNGNVSRIIPRDADKTAVPSGPRPRVRAVFTPPKTDCPEGAEGTSETCGSKP